MAPPRKASPCPCRAVHHHTVGPPFRAHAGQTAATPMGLYGGNRYTSDHRPIYNESRVPPLSQPVKRHAFTSGYCVLISTTSGHQSSLVVVHTFSLETRIATAAAHPVCEHRWDWRAANVSSSEPKTLRQRTMHIAGTERNGDHSKQQYVKGGTITTP